MYMAWGQIYCSKYNTKHFIAHKVDKINLRHENSKPQNFRNENITRYRLYIVQIGHICSFSVASKNCNVMCKILECTIQNICAIIKIDLYVDNDNQIYEKLFSKKNKSFWNMFQ